MVGVWLIGLASSSTPYGKVTCLILKKTSRRTQAVVVSEGIFCAARCCAIFYLQSMKVYLRMSNGNGQQNLAFYAQRILSLRIFCTAVLSRCKFSPPTVCVLCFPPVHSGHQVRWTYQPGSHRREVTQDFSSTFCGACLNFSREKDSAVPFPRRP